MSDTPFYDHLAATWQEQASGTAGSALAEGYRKQGRLDEALAVASEVVVRWPDFVPGYLALARVERERGRTDSAEQALRKALELDPSHPVVFSELAALAELTGNGGDARAWRQLREASLEPPRDILPAFLAGPATPAGRDFAQETLMEDELADPVEEVVSESLAALFEVQGHLERAAEIYAVLAERDPGNHRLREQRDLLLNRIAAQRPRPYDVRESGGISVRSWLGSLAVKVPDSPRDTGYDAFFQAPMSNQEPTEDFEAFQKWLKGLAR